MALYPTNKQKEFIVEFIENNLVTAKNQYSSIDAKQKFKNDWENIAIHANNLGGANKNTSQWKKFWEDLRARTRKKYALISSRINQSDNKGSSFLEFSDLEKRILSIIGIVPETKIDGSGETSDWEVSNATSTQLSEEIPALNTLATPTNNQLSSDKSQKYINLQEIEKKFLDESLDIKKRKLDALERIATAKEQELAIKQRRLAISEEFLCIYKYRNNSAMPNELLPLQLDYMYPSSSDTE